MAIKLSEMASSYFILCRVIPRVTHNDRLLNRLALIENVSENGFYFETHSIASVGLS